MKIIYFDRIPGNMLTCPPRISLIADSTLTLPGQPLFLPDYADNWVATFHPAIKISRLGKSISPKFADRYFNAMTVVMRLHPADSDQLPGVESVTDNTTAIGQWMPLPATDSPVTIEAMGTSAVIQSLTETATESVCSISRYTTLKMGDILMLCRIPATSLINIDTTVTAGINGTPALDIRIK